ncbi:hypothetical protein JB92DRAFT_2166371 [Gautieria morchelliformis]|nr:hypothetical protein JB92DRAFT_2166371 [Gautieria morchelliformis]
MLEVVVLFTYESWSNQEMEIPRYLVIFMGRDSSTVRDRYWVLSDSDSTVVLAVRNISGSTRVWFKYLESQLELVLVSDSWPGHSKHFTFNLSLSFLMRPLASQTLHLT